MVLDYLTQKSISLMGIRFLHFHSIFGHLDSNFQQAMHSNTEKIAEITTKEKSMFQSVKNAHKLTRVVKSSGESIDINPGENLRVSKSRPRFGSLEVEFCGWKLGWPTIKKSNRGLNSGRDQGLELLDKLIIRRYI